MEIHYTYLKRRKCLQCHKPLCDQTHALQKFCKRIKLSDGSVLSCKDDFHSAKRKLEKAPFKGFAIHQEKMRDNARNLFKKHGEVVSLEEINRFGIKLNRPAEIEWSKDGFPIFYFVEYALVKTNGNKYQIIKHGRVF